MTNSAKLNAKHSSTAEALTLFDSLAPVDTDFMIGSWRGEGFRTGHVLDGVLEAYHWYGKRFDSEEDVHPLVFSKRGGGFACVNPKYMAPMLKLIDYLPILKSPAIGHIFQILIPLLSTKHSGARLRMTTYRGISSATMIYDQLPINDVFRKVDDDTLLGVMDLKGMPQPFFFMLHRCSDRL